MEESSIHGKHLLVELAPTTSRKPDYSLPIVVFNEAVGGGFSSRSSEYPLEALPVAYERRMRKSDGFRPRLPGPHASSWHEKRRPKPSKHQALLRTSTPAKIRSHRRRNPPRQGFLSHSFVCNFDPRKSLREQMAYGRRGALPVADYLERFREGIHREVDSTPTWPAWAANTPPRPSCRTGRRHSLSSKEPLSTIGDVSECGYNASLSAPGEKGVRRTKVKRIFLEPRRPRPCLPSLLPPWA